MVIIAFHVCAVFADSTSCAHRVATPESGITDHRLAQERQAHGNDFSESFHIQRHPTFDTVCTLPDASCHVCAATIALKRQK